VNASLLNLLANMDNSIFVRRHWNNSGRVLTRTTHGRTEYEDASRPLTLDYAHDIFQSEGTNWGALVSLGTPDLRLDDIIGSRWMRGTAQHGETHTWNHGYMKRDPWGSH